MDDHTDSPLAAADYHPPPPRHLDTLIAIAGTITVPFAFSHCTAAEILGWPIPWRARVTGDIHVITDTETGQLRRPGFVGHRGLEARLRCVLHGLPIIAPAHTWGDLGELVGRGLPYTFEDIIGAGDQALNAGCTREQLRDVVNARIRPRGKRTLLPAIPWMRRGAESQLETSGRLCLQRAGLPRPALNRNVFDTKGEFLFRPDAAWRAKRVAVEFQGAEVHDNPEAVAAYGSRVERGDRHGWTFIEMRSEQIWDKPSRDAMLIVVAEALDFPTARLNLFAAEPQIHSAEAAATLLENLQRRHRRRRAQALSTR